MRPRPGPYRIKSKPRVPPAAPGGPVIFAARGWTTHSVHHTLASAAAAFGQRPYDPAEICGIYQQGRRVLPLRAPVRAHRAPCPTCQTVPMTDGLRRWCGCGTQPLPTPLLEEGRPA